MGGWRRKINVLSYYRKWILKIWFWCRVQSWCGKEEEEAAGAVSLMATQETTPNYRAAVNACTTVIIIVIKVLIITIVIVLLSSSYSHFNLPTVYVVYLDRWWQPQSPVISSGPLDPLRHNKYLEVDSLIG